MGKAAVDDNAIYENVGDEAEDRVKEDGVWHLGNRTSMSAAKLHAYLDKVLKDTEVISV